MSSNQPIRWPSLKVDVPDIADPLRVLQISDCHLSDDPEGDLLGIVTLSSFDAVMAEVEKLEQQPDMVFVSGDLVQDYTASAYERLAKRLSVFECPVHWYPGNHDDIALMRTIAPSSQFHEKQFQANGWNFVFLDSSVPKRVFGTLDDSELTFLDDQLSRYPDLQHVVCLHHHPVDIGSEWLDKIGLHNRDQFWSVLDRYQNVRAVVWGHIHQEFSTERAGVRLMASPSTCVQFLPESKDFALDDAHPGFRLLSCYTNGEIASEVHRAVDFQAKPDMASTGY